MFPKLPYCQQMCKAWLPGRPDLGLGVMVWSPEHLVPVSSPLPSWVLRCGLSQNVFAQDMKSHFKMRESRRGGGDGAARQRGHKPHSPGGPERSVSSRPFASIIERFLFTHPVQPVFKDTLCALVAIEWTWSRWRNWANLGWVCKSSCIEGAGLTQEAVGTSLRWAWAGLLMLLIRPKSSLALFLINGTCGIEFPGSRRPTSFKVIVPEDEG